LAEASTFDAPLEPGVQPAAAVAVDRRARNGIFAAVLLAMLLAGLDQTVVGTALPRIVTDLQGSDRFVWVVTAYLLSSTVSIPVYGKFSDVYGRKAMLLVGVGLFLLGSGLSGLSQTMNQLIGFRALQGLGAGAILPVATATIGDLFSPRERGRAQGMFGAVAGLSILIGPFIGGWITDHISWHWVFYVNLPPGLVALAALWTLLPNRRLDDARATDLDYLGIALFVLAVVPIMVGLTNKGEVDASTEQLYSWTSAQVGGLIGLGAVLLLLFVLTESKARHPIVPLDLFRNRDYSLSMSAAFILGMAGFVAVIFMPRYYQTVRGIGATSSGFYMWPLLISFMVGGIGAGVLITRLGRYKWLISGSAAILIAGGVLMTHLSPNTVDWTLSVWMVVLGLGMGPSLSAFTVVVQSVVPMNRIGAASGTLLFMRQIGSAMGLAIAGTVFSAIYLDQLPKSLAAQGLPAPLVDLVAKLSQALQGVGAGDHVLARVLPASQQHLIPQIVAGANDAFAKATGAAFWMTLITGVVGLVLTLGLRDRELKDVRPTPEPDDSN
jgi:EmrB/QacA subfamily drug resistance transporter